MLIGLAVVALLFIYFTFLFCGRQKSANRELEDAYAELEEAQAGQKNHTAELEKLRKLNGSYEMQIEHLVLTVRELEKVNVELAKKKKLLEKNQNKLEELQSQKDEVLSGVVSDITNPADAIRELIALLESYDLNATEQRDVIESLMHSSSNLIKLAQRISTVVTKGAPKTNRADGPMKLAPASLKPIINDVVNNNIAYAERKNVELINNATVGMPETNIDKDAMAQVIDQLINNAVKFSPPETSVRVKSYFSPDKVVVEVTDNGVGIPEDELPRVFEKGVTLSPQPTGDEASAGVGLYEAKKIVDKHRGKIFVKSRQGVGTSFIVELPREGEE
ncbi:MAG: hypothetical protein GF419_09380 [Ignavibacteriales bacterium]|nr:hypothetical protein [Ignavibacteriales bacterium]